MNNQDGRAASSETATPAAIYDVDYTRTLPEALKNDPAVLALAKTISGALQENARLSRLAVVYPRIDELEEELLDILAYDLHVDWYEYSSTIEVKREILKNSVKVHKRIGTKYAVESVVKSYLRSGLVSEWFEYSGVPYFFRIITTDIFESAQQVDELLRAVNTLKNVRSWLECIIIKQQFNSGLYLGTSSNTASYESLAAKTIEGVDLETVVYTGTAAFEQIKEVVSAGVLKGVSVAESLYEGSALMEKSVVAFKARRLRDTVTVGGLYEGTSLVEKTAVVFRTKALRDTVITGTVHEGARAAEKTVMALGTRALRNMAVSGAKYAGSSVVDVGRINIVTKPVL